MTEEKKTPAEPDGSRADFLIHLQRLIDMTVEDLAMARARKDADENEIRPIRSAALKLVKIWNNASPKDQQGSKKRESSNVKKPGDAENGGC